VIRRCSQAAAIGSGVGALALIVGLAMGWGKAYVGKLDFYALLSTIGIVALAIRDELLLRGFAFHAATKAGLRAPTTMAFCALLSMAFILPRGAGPGALALAGATGLLYATVYRHLGGAGPAIVAHAAWSLIIGPFSRGAIADVEWTNGELIDGANAAGAPAFVAAGLATVAALGLMRLPVPQLPAEVDRRDQNADGDRPAGKEPERLEESDPG
jgi:hypothetical protein